jgi:hypothetical protein
MAATIVYDPAGSSGGTPDMSVTKRWNCRLSDAYE